MRVQSLELSKTQASMANELKAKQEKAFIENMEAHARAKWELEQQEKLDAKSDVSSEGKVSYGTVHHEPTHAYLPPPQYQYAPMGYPMQAPPTNEPYNTLAAKN